MAELVAAASGRALEVRRRPGAARPHGAESFGLVADIDATAAVLGWRPGISLEEGLRPLLIEVLRG